MFLQGPVGTLACFVALLLLSLVTVYISIYISKVILACLPVERRPKSGSWLLLLM